MKSKLLTFAAVLLAGAAAMLAVSPYTRARAQAIAGQYLTTGQVLIGVTGAAPVAGFVDSASLASGSVQTAKLASDAVTAPKILDGAVNTNKIALESIDTTKMRKTAAAAGYIKCAKADNSEGLCTTAPVGMSCTCN